MSTNAEENLKLSQRLTGHLTVKTYGGGLDVQFRVTLTLHLDDVVRFRLWLL